MSTLLSKKSLTSSQSYRLDTSFKGTILIPDISGFTKFVNETEFAAGREITRQLLQVVINNNILDLKISEIEGDAILFYSRSTFSVVQIKDQYEIMLKGFREKVKKLSEENGFKIDLTLKLIAHYGEISTYFISDFEKLYGKAVIEAHELLKNSIKSKSYFLLSDTLIRAKEKKFASTCYYSGSLLCDIYGDLKKICYAYFDYEEDKQKSVIRAMDEILEEEKVKLSF